MPGAELFFKIIGGFLKNLPQFYGWKIVRRELQQGTFTIILLTQNQLLIWF